MRWFKRIAIGVAILVVVVAAGLAALLLLVDPNHYKGPLADAVKKRYDRTLRIDGDLKLSVFPRLGVQFQKLSLSEPRSAQIFAAVDAAQASVAVLPLLSGRVVVDRIRVEGLKANLVRYQNGAFNFADLLGEGGQEQPAGPQPLEAGGKPLVFDVAGIEFSGAELALRDYVKGTALRVEKLSASTGRVAPRVPFDFEVSARLLGQSPRVDATVQSLGKLSFDPERRQYSVKGFDLKASGVLPSIRATALTARGDVAFDGQRGALDASGLEVLFQGDVAGNRPLTGVDLRLEAPRLAVGLEEGRLQAEKLSLAAQGRLGADPFDISLAAPSLRVSAQEAAGETLTGRLRLGGGKDLDLRLALSGLSGNGEKLEVAKLALDGDFRQGARTVKLGGVSPFEASLRGKSFALPQWAGQIEIEDPALPNKRMRIPVKAALRANLDREQAAARIDAEIEGGPFSLTADVAQFDEPRIAFALAADTLDIDKLLPAGRQAGAPAAGTAGPAADAPVDLSPLQGFSANGTVKIGKLVVRGLKAGDVSASLRVAKGRADVSALKASLYGGTLSGSLFADAATHRIGFAPTLSNVSVQPLLVDVAGKDTLMGRGNVALNLTATGKTVEAMKRGLNGTASVSLRDGAVKGVNLAQSLREFRALLSQRKDDAHTHQASQQTDFTELQTKAVFANGVGTLRDLSMKAPLLRVTEGSPARIDVPAERLDLAVNVMVVNTSTGQAGKELEELRNVTIPVHVAGSFDAPSYTIGWSKIAADVLKNTLKGKIEEKLGTQPEAIDKARDAVRERLKGLFNR